MLNHCTMENETKTVPYQIVSQVEIPLGYPSAGLYRELLLTNKGAHCPDCSTWSVIIHEHHPKKVISGCHNGVPVIDSFIHRRFECSYCHCTFMERLTWLKPYQRITESAHHALLFATAEMTFKAVGESFGRSGQNIRVHLRDHCPQISNLQDVATPSLIGMDEISLAKGKGSYRWVLYDLSVPERPQLLMIHQSRKKKDVIQLLESFSHPERIVAAAIDMWRPYRDAIEATLPQALIVVDAFHLIQASSRALDDVRKKIQSKLPESQRISLKQDKDLLTKLPEECTSEEQEKLQQWEESVPELARALALHQKLRTLYRCQDFEEALSHLVDWEAEVLNTDFEPFHKLLETMWNWLPEIMNRFVCHLSNAKAEGKNNLLRAMNKQGFGYSPHSLQARMEMKEQRTALHRWRNKQEKLLQSA